MTIKGIIRSTEIIAFIALFGLVTAFGFSNSQTVRVFMIGDSTMAERQDLNENPERGWGQKLSQYFEPAVAIHNHAVNGRSTRSFIDEGRWKVVLDSLMPGDYLVIQFAHNDQKDKDPTRFTNPYTTYRKNLLHFVEGARAKGATPILVSPVVRRKFNDEGVLRDTHGAYPFVMRAVAREYDVTFIDLQLRSEELVTELGPEKSKELYVWVEPGEFEKFPDGREDDTHFGERGASEISRLFVEELGKSDLDLKNYIN